MPKYQIYFDTISGESRYNVDIDDGETLDMVLEEILFDLRERGDMLKGDGEPEVLWNGKTLDFAAPLNGQGVRGERRAARFDRRHQRMTSVLERRLHAEWDLLQELAALNPDRLGSIDADDTVFSGTLHGIATAPVVPGAGTDATHRQQFITSHRFRVQFPLHFPAVPMELYLQTPVQHPNIHPETGFVCLWDRHRVSNSVELALHKLAAMLSGHLYNAAALHVMQPGALAAMGTSGAPIALLTGVRHTAAEALATPASGRRRLS